MHFVRTVPLLLCCLLLAGCNLFASDSPPQRTSAASSASVLVDSGPINHPVVTHGCGQATPVSPGTSADQMFPVNPAEALGHNSRSYRVHIPVGYQSTMPTALVLYFHGHGGTATGADSGSGFSSLADQQHFIAAYGQGLPEGEDGPPFWADTGPIDYGVDDLHYVSLMLDDLQSKFCIDARRIFAAGFSNGGGMSNYLACNLAGRIAAFVPVSGDNYVLHCRPARPVPIMDIDGSADQLVPYQGIPASLNPAWPEPSIPQQLQDWAKRDDCQQGPTVFLRTTQVMGENWTNCQGSAEVAHYLIIGGGHSWPDRLGNRSSLEVVWDFFQAHPLPQ